MPCRRHISKLSHKYIWKQTQNQNKNKYKKREIKMKEENEINWEKWD